MASALELLMGKAGTKDEPLEIVVTHEIAPLNSPVTKVAGVVIASALVLLLIHQLSKPS